MKYCPECEAEYTDVPESCSDCGVPLISADEFERRKARLEEEREALSREEFVSVKVAESAFEADRLRDALEQEGIPVLLRTFQDTAYDGIYVAQKGWGHVEVPESERARAERIVADLAGAFPEPANGETGGPEE